ncbi:hypothetical protein ACHAXR_005660 [Thalassiosira sp. AJA248-18]
MKLLRSTFLAFYLASSASAFVPPQISSLSTTARTNNAIITKQQSRLYVGIHEPSPSSITDEEIQKETLFRQVMREVDMAKEYLGWLIDECNAATTTDGEEEGGPTLQEVLAEKAAAGEVELFGGGGDGPPSTTGESSQKETQYQPSLRTNLGSTILLSGEGTADSTLLNALNNNYFGSDQDVANFEFTKIRALVEDVAAAKKKAIGRQARYSGLLDKLVIEPSSTNGALPSKEELEGVGSWIVQLTKDDVGEGMLSKIAELAKDSSSSSDLNNVVVLVVGDTSDSVEGWDSVVEASANGEAFKCTLLTVGELYEGENTGGFYRVGKLEATTATPTKLSTKKAYQMLAHTLALDCTANQALVAYEYPPAAIEAIASPYAEGEFALRDDDGEEIVDEFKDIKMESRVLQAMREVGFTPVMELDVLVGKGLAGYKEYEANPPNKENAFSKAGSSIRDKVDEEILAKLDKEIAENEARKKVEAEKQKAIEVEGIAKEWAIKEYSLRMLVGDLDDSVTEKDFMVSVMDEALAEADATYDRIHSEEYIKQQERIEKDKVGVENKLFWDGMDPLMRKKREKMVEKVKEQYMDLLSEEDLERIILSE